MQTMTGTMTTERPARFAKQLVSHWSGRGPVEEVDGATVQRWESGQVLVLRAGEGVLGIEVTVPDGADPARFAQVVKEHLERFGARDELDVVWAG